MNVTSILQFLVSGISDGCIYGLVGLSFMVIFRTCRVINFALGDFAVFGGLFMFSLVNQMRFPMVVAFFVAVTGSVLVGIACERLAILPFDLRRIRGISKSMAMLGASLVFVSIVAIIWGKDPLSYPPLTGDTPFFVGGVAIHPQAIWIVFITTVVVSVVWWFFRNTRLGKSMRATAENEMAAVMVGIPVHLMSLCSFAIGSAIAAIAGILLAPISYTGYGAGGMFSLKGFVAAAIVGTRGAFAAVIGGLCLGILENIGAGLISSGYKNFFSLAVLIIALLIRYRPLAGVEGALEHEATEAH